MGGMVNVYLCGSLVCKVLSYILPVDSWQPCEYDSIYFTNEETVSSLELSGFFKVTELIRAYICLFIHLLILPTFMEHRLWDMMDGDLNEEA